MCSAAECRKAAVSITAAYLLRLIFCLKIKVDIVVCRVPVSDVIKAAVKILYTGHIGDGKIFVYDVRMWSKSELENQDMTQ